MKVIVYVEGPSDKYAMEALFANLIEEKRQGGITISFNHPSRGDAKKELLLHAPLRAVNVLSNDPNTKVAIVPDLYPQNKGFEHSSFEEMEFLTSL